MGAFKQKLFVPDFIKGIAILWVVVFHLFKGFPAVFQADSFGVYDTYYRLMMHGALGVDLFVILSGFLLTRSIMAKKTVNWNIFLKKRFLRIFPLYWFAIAVLVILDFSIGSENATFNLASIFYHILGVQGFTQYIFDMEGAWWYITLIIQLYLIFPVFCWLNEKLSSKYLLVVIVVVSIGARFVPLANVNGNYSLFAFLVDFYLGIVVAREFSPDLQCTLNAFGKLYCLISLLAFLISLYMESISVFSYGYGLFRPIVSFGIFLTLSSLGTYLRGTRLRKICEVFLLYGKHSYAIYLFHRIFIYKYITLSAVFLMPFFQVVVFVAVMLPMGYVLELCEFYLRRSFASVQT